MKQDTDTNRTQPWTRGTGTWAKRMRIHTSPPETCGEEKGRGSDQESPGPESTLESWALYKC